jgi:hypothetical protein
MALQPTTCARAALLARWHPIEDVAVILGVHMASIYRLKQRGFQPPPCGRRPMPTDFSIQARFKTTRELMAHYKAGPLAVRRWLEERPRPRFKPGKVRQQVSR